MQISVKKIPTNLPETLVIPVVQSDDLEQQLTSIAEKTGISVTNLSADFKADAKEVLPFYFEGTKKAYLVGLGKSPSSHKIIQACRSFAFKLLAKLPAKVSVLADAEHIEYAVNGLLLARYNINFYKTKEAEVHPFQSKKAAIEVLTSATLKAAKQAAEKGKVTAETQLQIFDLVNKPSNKKTPEVLANWAVKSGKENGFKVTVLKRAEIEKTGLHGLLAVNRGSEYPPRFIIMEYKPKGKKNLPKIGLVGKGVTFDTGGLSLKPSTNMHYMKSDMGGAGAVFGTMELVAKLGLPVHLIAIVPATDNCVDAMAIKPSDVIGSYSGKTIEIIDTDAEGRLILADGLAYMERHFKPEIMLDLATLTGSCIRALGYVAAGLMTQNDELAAELEAAGQTAGERLFRLPMWDDYGSMIKSDVADVKNFSGKPMAGATTAGKFLEHFTNEHPKWAHLDIAGMAIGVSEFATDRNASAFGVRLLLQFIENQLVK